MGRGWMTGAMLAIAALPVSASAQTDAFADCAADRADAGLKRSLAAALINGADDSVVDPMMAQYAAISSVCTADWALDDAQRKAYLDYGVMRLMRDWLASELAGYGLSAATVDEALDFGPGRRNAPLAGGMREDEVKELVQAFIEAGIDAENLSAPAWEAVGTYAAVSPIFWRKRQQVSAWMLVPKHAAPPPAPVAASVAPAVEPVPPAPMPAPRAVPSEPAPVAADTSTMSVEPSSVPISDPVVEPVAVPIEAAAPEEEPAPSAPEPASPAAATPAPQESAPMPAETATPEAPAPEVPDTPAPAEPAPDATSVDPVAAPMPVSAGEAAPAEAAAAPAEPAAPVILPYEPLPDAVDPVLPGGAAPASAEEPPAEPSPGV